MTEDNLEGAPAKKGRPTPKRKDAEAKRVTNSLAPAKNRADKAKQKEMSKQQRLSARSAYMRGDENALPARDRGPARRFVRDFVDSRRSVGESSSSTSLSMVRSSNIIFISTSDVRSVLDDVR